MTAAQLVRDLECQGVILSACGEDLSFDAPHGVMTGDLRAALLTAKANLLPLLRQPGHYGRWAVALLRLVISDPHRRAELQHDFDERAGILEYEANLARRDAEERALHVLCRHLSIRIDRQSPMI